MDTTTVQVDTRDEVWLSVNKSMAAAGVSRRTIYNWMGAGRLTVKRTAGGSPRILESSLFRADRRYPDR